MKVLFRDATKDDVPAILQLLTDDDYGRSREVDDIDLYLQGFDQMAGESANHLVVGEYDHRIVATFQLTFITGLAHQAVRRANVESVRVASDLRGQGIGHLLMAEAERRARAAGCRMMQLTTHAGRNQARDFYDGLGWTPSHIGYKRILA